MERGQYVFIRQGFRPFQIHFLRFVSGAPQMFDKYLKLKALCRTYYTEQAREKRFSNIITMVTLNILINLTGRIDTWLFVYARF